MNNRICVNIVSIKKCLRGETQNLACTESHPGPSDTSHPILLTVCVTNPECSRDSLTYYEGYKMTGEFT